MSKATRVDGEAEGEVSRTEIGEAREVDKVGQGYDVFKQCSMLCYRYLCTRMMCFERFASGALYRSVRMEMSFGNFDSSVRVMWHLGSVAVACGIRHLRETP